MNNNNQCYVTTLTGPNRGNLCNCKVGIINGKCRTHRVQYIDVSTEYNERDEYNDRDEYDFDDGFMVHDDDEEAEFDDDYQPPKKRKREKMSEKMSEKMPPQPKEVVIQPKDQPKVTAIQPKVTAIPQIQPKVTVTQPKVTAIPQIQPKVTVTQPINLNRNLLENTFATLSLFDLRAFTGIQNINLQPMHERAFIISAYFDFVNASNA
jgi:hypothetical protein